MSEESKLADKYKQEVDRLEETLASALIDFTTRTGFLVEDIAPFYHEFRGEDPYYSIVVKIKL